MGKGKSIPYNPHQELLVLQTIQNLGEATEEEIKEYLEKVYGDKAKKVFLEGVEKSSHIIERIIRRWEKKNAITSKVHDGQRMYSLQDIPWFGRLKMIHVLTLAPEAAKQYLQTLEEELREKGVYSGRGPLYRNFAFVECIFETIDPILGGDISSEERVLIFPRKDGKPYIRESWIRGFIRDNLPLVNVNTIVARDHCAYREGEIIEKEPKLFRTPPIRVKEGHNVYEALASGQKFKTVLGLPLNGTSLRTLDDWKDFFRKLEIASIRGLGAHSHVYGGKIRLLEMKPLN